MVRLRPLNEREQLDGTLPVVTASTQRKQVEVVRGVGTRSATRQSFQFDNVFGSYAEQEEIFSETLKPIVDDMLQGYESTVFAYGQTGTGKTFTMEGNISKEADHGVIPRSAAAIFRVLAEERYVESRVTCSYLEIDNEELGDLLLEDSASTKQKLQIVAGGKNRRVHCMGLTEHEVQSPEEVIRILHKAQEKRTVAETRMNKASSRSHCLFTLSVHSTEKITEGGTTSMLERHGKLHMVDLAGR